MKEQFSSWFTGAGSNFLDKAIGAALNAAKPGDVVILAGKGAEVTQRIRGEFVPYISDAKAVQRWIKENS